MLPLVYKARGWVALVNGRELPTQFYDTREIALAAAERCAELFFSMGFDTVSIDAVWAEGEIPMEEITRYMDLEEPMKS